MDDQICKAALIMNDNELSNYQRFGKLTFSDFKAMAKDPSLSCYEKIGFPDTYRENKENHIFTDILSKLTILQEKNKTVLDIGPGCSRLPNYLIELCQANNHQLILIDSKEMLDLLPNAPFITKIPAFYPAQCKDFISEYKQKIDVILSYSILHYIFNEANIFEFLDNSLNLLSNNGQFLIGDIPNVSMRKRFLNSPEGISHHQKFYEKDGMPQIDHFVVEHNTIDDSVLLGMMMRTRQAGFDCYLVPQSKNLPMSNRREDMLIFKP